MSKPRMSIVMALLVLCACANAQAFNVASGQKLPVSITYACDAEFEPNFLEAFKTWNLACNNIFTLTRADSNPTILVSTFANIPISNVRPEFEAYCIQEGLTAKIAIKDNTFAVMLHEMGHAFGLTHSDYDGNSVMYPKNNVPYLSEDDVLGICSIYGQSPMKFEKIRVRRIGLKIKVVSKCNVTWVWGDGSRDTTGMGFKFHTYPARGWYQLKSVKDNIATLLEFKL